MYITSAKVEKGIIYCLTDTNKVIQINFNTDTIIGVSGKPIKTCPAFGDYIKNIYNPPAGENLLGFICKYYYKYAFNKTEILDCRIMKYADRLLNMGFNKQEIAYIISYYSAWRKSENKLNYDDTYRMLAKASKSFLNFNIDEAIIKYERQQFFNEIKLPFDVLEEIQKNYIYDRYISASETEKCYFKKYINYIAYWVAFEEFEYYNSRIWTYSGNMFNNMYQYFQACEKLKIEPAKKNIYKHTITTYKAYEQLKDMQLSEQIKEKQISNKIKFFFEDDNYTMIFPTSVKEFIDEGKALNNCLGWNHYANKVANNSAVVCFIRNKKNVNEPFVACDIRFHKGYYINQFLGKSNSDPLNNELIIKYYKNLSEFVHNIKN